MEKYLQAHHQVLLSDHAVKKFSFESEVGRVLGSTGRQEHALKTVKISCLLITRSLPYH
jgi:hypothetical protein